MPGSTQKAGQGGLKYIHPFVAWTAILSFAMVFSLAPSLLIAQRSALAAEVNAEVRGTVPQVTSEVTSCRHTCYDARTACMKSAGSDQTATGQCNTTAKDCLSTCGPGTASTATTAPKLYTSKGDKTQRSANEMCVRSCQTTRLDCMQSAAGNSTAMHACSQTNAACVETCASQSGSTTSGANMTARQAYLAATAAARKAYQDAMKKAHDDYAAALKQAQADYAAAKAAGQTPSSTGSSTTDSSTTHSTTN